MWVRQIAQKIDGKIAETMQDAQFGAVRSVSAPPKIKRAYGTLAARLNLIFLYCDYIITHLESFVNTFLKKFEKK